ncbi:MAG: hypothetical protein NTY08_16055 [Proteobacteria bacterium]|nr:hypothetical protein [Pseudomonadota bacterium]
MTAAVQHVGVTRSGNAIQVPILSDEPKQELPPACALYTPADHFDAYAVFEYLLSRELRRRPAAARARRMYQHMSTSHYSKLAKVWRHAERLALGLATIFDVLEHGKGLADRIFKD